MKTLQAMILWDWSKEKGVHNVMAVEHPPRVHYPQQFSDGACCSDWKAQELSTLGTIFGQMLGHGFKSPASMVDALEAFAAIEDCGPWARDLIDGMKAWCGSSLKDEWDW